MSDDTNLTIQQRFEAFHAANPAVLVRLEELAVALTEAGQRRIGLKMLFEVLRYERMLQTKDPHSEWKLNNVYTSRYARLMIERFPSLEDYIETRTLQAA